MITFQLKTSVLAVADAERNFSFPKKTFWKTCTVDMKNKTLFQKGQIIDTNQAKKKLSKMLSKTAQCSIKNWKESRKSSL